MRAWRFAKRAYARPDVAAACLALQDDYGQCVSLLLWRLWARAAARPIPGAMLAAAVALARDWEETVLEQLRRARRSLKAPAEGLDPARQQALRAAVADAELAAERLLIEALEQMTAAATGGQGERMADLRALVAVWAQAGGETPPDSALRRLVAAMA